MIAKLQFIKGASMNSKKTLSQRWRGFTLIELMIVVAIGSILMAIAMPSYQAYVARGRRADAKAGLQQASLWMERAQTATGTYPLTAAFPASLTVAGNPQTYQIALASNGAAYTLTATPIGVQAGDACGNFTLTNTGVRNVVGVIAPMTLAQCWGR